MSVVYSVEDDEETRMQRVTLHLSETTIKRARQAADVLQRPLEDVLTTMLDATLPDMEDAPADMQAELARMTWLSSEALWDIAKSYMVEEEQEQLFGLSELQAQRELTRSEAERLEKLRREYGRVTLRKARAYALLSLRGGQPLLKWKLVA
jgi:hypothetical protein